MALFGFLSHSLLSLFLTHACCFPLLVFVSLDFMNIKEKKLNLYLTSLAFLSPSFLF